MIIQVSLFTRQGLNANIISFINKQLSLTFFPCSWLLSFPQQLAQQCAFKFRLCYTTYSKALLINNVVVFTSLATKITDLLSLVPGRFSNNIALSSFTCVPLNMKWVLYNCIVEQGTKVNHSSILTYLLSLIPGRSRRLHAHRLPVHVEEALKEIKDQRPKTKDQSLKINDQITLSNFVRIITTRLTANAKDKDRTILAHFNPQISCTTISPYSGRHRASQYAAR